MAKRKRIPKSAKGLAIPKGGCRIVEGKVKICVSKTGIISMTPSKGGGTRKRKAGPKKKSAAKKKAPAKRGKARCVTPPFKLKTKKGVRCTCGVRTKAGGIRPQFLPMADPRCSGGLPGPMSWKSFVAKGTPARPVPGGWTKLSGIGRRKRRPVRRRRR